jgi:exodeoxyribonuclease V alpha subunit
MTKNNNKKHYINGDIGFIKDISNERMTVEFKNKTLELDREDYQYMDLAYSITIHKSQGSEFDDVFIVLPPDAEHMMTRRLLYTASTRAKKSVHIYYMQDSLNKAIDNKKETIRVSLLKDRLLEYLKNNT